MGPPGAGPVTSRRPAAPPRPKSGRGGGRPPFQAPPEILARGVRSIANRVASHHQTGGLVRQTPRAPEVWENELCQSLVGAGTGTQSRRHGERRK